jgi:hypothetical protein
MNILDVYIKEIYSEDIKHIDDWFGKPTDFVKVDMMTDCWGCHERMQRNFHIEEWEQIKKEMKFQE